VRFSGISYTLYLGKYRTFQCYFLLESIAPYYGSSNQPTHKDSQSLRIQLEGTSVTVIERAPPGVETPLYRGEFAEETRGQKAMPVDVLAARAIAGIEAGKLEIRPGLSNVLRP
jgi:uncharacterized oxidoreductase